MTVTRNIVAPAALRALAALMTAAGGIVCALGPAMAQHASIPSSADNASGPSSTRGGGSVTAPLPDDSETAPDIPSIIPDDDPTQDAREYDPLDPSPADGQRPVVRDGDLSWPREPTAPRDGVVAPVEPRDVRDGVDPLIVDTRPAEDIDAFENPPAGYDPLLFQIEDITPFQDRRTQRLARFEPYDPVGIRIGSFVLFPEVEFGGSWYSNVFRSPSAESDQALDLRPSARLVSDWKRHALEFRAASTLSQFNEFDSENERGYQLEARGRLDITSRTNMQGFVSRDYSQESRSAIDANAAGERANLTVDQVGATLNHRFNRLSLRLRGTVGDYQYSDVNAGNAVQSNRDRDYKSYEEAVRASWEFKPTLTGFTEVAVNQRRYEEPAQSDNILRDSDGQRYRVGISFGDTGRILRGEIALGYGVQTPDDKRLQAIEGVLIDANVAWRMSELTSLSFNARTDVYETTTTNIGGVLTRSAGVELRHAFRRQLIGTAGITYTDYDYQGSPISENELRGDLGIEYFLSREASLFGRYRHTMFESNQAGSSYAADEVHVGVRLRR